MGGRKWNTGGTLRGHMGQLARNFFRPEIATSGVQNAIDVLIWPCEVLEAHLYFPPEKPS